MPGSLNCDAIVPKTGSVSSAASKSVVVALALLAHVAQRVERAALVELVDRDEVREVEHVDLLELRRGAVLGGHDVERDVGVLDDLGVGLADARGLDDRPGRSRRRWQISIDVAHVLARAPGSTAAWRASACRRAGRRSRSCGCGRRAARRRSCASTGRPRARRASCRRSRARKRRTSSSTSDDLPAPPVPVMPRTGATALSSRGASARRSASRCVGEVLGDRDERARSPPGRARRAARASGSKPAPGSPRKSHCSSRSSIIPWRPIARPSSGRVDARDRRTRGARSISVGQDRPAAAAEHLDVPGAALARADRSCT